MLLQPPRLDQLLQLLEVLPNGKDGCGRGRGAGAGEAFCD